MANLVEMVNGRLQHMSDADQSVYIETQTFVAQQVALPQPPDLATQVANLTAFVVNGTPIPTDQIDSANAVLEASGQPIITVESLNIAKPV